MRRSLIIVALFAAHFSTGCHPAQHAVVTESGGAAIAAPTDGGLAAEPSHARAAARADCESRRRGFAAARTLGAFWVGKRLYIKRIDHSCWSGTLETLRSLAG